MFISTIITQSYLLRSDSQLALDASQYPSTLKKIMIAPNSPTPIPTRTGQTICTALATCLPNPPAYKLATCCNQQSLGTPVVPHNMCHITRDFTVMSNSDGLPTDITLPISHPESPLSPITSLHKFS